MASASAPPSETDSPGATLRVENVDGMEDEAPRTTRRLSTTVVGHASSSTDMLALTDFTFGAQRSQPAVAVHPASPANKSMAVDHLFTGGLTTSSRSPRAHTSHNRELRALRSAFERFDVDKSGTIDISELKAFMTHLGYHLSDADLRNLIEQVSTTDGTTLQFVDIVRLMQMYKEAAQFKLIEVEHDADDELVDPLSPDATCVQRLLHKVPFMHTDSFVFGVWQSIMLGMAVYMWCCTLYGDLLSDGELILWFEENALIYFFGFLASVVDIGLQTRVFRVPTFRSRLCTAVDAVTTVPFELFVLIAALSSSNQSGSATALRVLMHLKLLRLISAHNSYFVASNVVQVNRRYIALFCYIVPGLVSASYLIAIAQLLAVIWASIPASTASSRGYVASLYVASYSITGVGYGNVDSSTDGERLLGAAFCLVAQSLSAFVVGSIVGVLGDSDVQGDGDHQVLEVARIVDIAGISSNVQMDAVSFQDHLVRNKINDSYSDLFGNLPTELNSNITLFVKVRLLANDSVFRIAHRATQVALARSLVSTVMRPGEALFTYGDLIHDMMFIGHGEVEMVASDGVRDSLLQTGDHLNETALIFGSELADFTARCVAHSEIFVLTKKQYTAIRARFPVFDLEMRRLAKFIQDKLMEQQTLLAEARGSEARVDMPSPDADIAMLPLSPDATDGSTHASSGVIQVGSASGNGNPLEAPAPELEATATFNQPADAKRSMRTISGPQPPPAAQNVDLTYTTSAGQTIDLGRLSATFRLNAATSPFSFRRGGAGGSFSSPKPGSVAPDEDARLQALAKDEFFGRLEPGVGDDAVDSSDDDSQGSPREDHTNAFADGVGGGVGASFEEAPYFDDIEEELAEIERLLSVLEATRASFSVLSKSNGSPSAVASPVGSLRLDPTTVSALHAAGSVGRMLTAAPPASVVSRVGTPYAHLPSQALSHNAFDDAHEVRDSGELSGAPS